MEPGMSVWDRIPGARYTGKRSDARGGGTRGQDDRPRMGRLVQSEGERQFVDSLATDLGKAVLEATALDVATALDKFR